MFTKSLRPHYQPTPYTSTLFFEDLKREADAAHAKRQAMLFRRRQGQVFLLAVGAVLAYCLTK
jgi:hypothetical protein